jgi:hypothetical protein
MLLYIQFYPNDSITINRSLIFTICDTANENINVKLKTQATINYAISKS